MKVNPIGNGNYYIEIQADEMCGADLCEVIRAGAPELPSDTAYEVFGGAEGALVFARVQRGEHLVQCCPAVYKFASLTDVLAAATDGEAHSKELVTFLAKVDDSYCILFYPSGVDAPPTELQKHGVAVPTAYALHAAEHGEPLLGPYALRDLRRGFGTA